MALSPQGEEKLCGNYVYFIHNNIYFQIKNVFMDKIHIVATEFLFPLGTQSHLLPQGMMYNNKK